MDLIIKTFKSRGDIHHAYLIVGDKDSLKKELISVLDKISGTKSKSEYSYFDTETFGIGDARTLKETQSRINIMGKQFFIISPSFITREAQNALLKIFEEPTNDTHFFILSRSTDTILPTLLSRMVIISGKQENSKEGLEFAEKFIASQKEERIKLLDNILSESRRLSALEFINNLEYVLSKNPEMKKNYEVLSDLRLARSHLNKNRGNVKMLLENIALLLT